MVKRIPLPSFVGVKSIRKLPGRDIASYHVSTFRLPSLSMFVVFCTNVAVRYHDFAYFFCIASMSWPDVVIFEAEAIVVRTKSKTRLDKTRIAANLSYLIIGILT